MTPLRLLDLVLAITAIAACVNLLLRKRLAEALRQLATDWRMNFTQTDLLRLTEKVARHFPIPGAAHLRVSNVIYGTDKDRYRYVFKAEYTTGVIDAKRRVTRAGAFSEFRDRQRGGAPTPVLLAPANLPLLEQYRWLGPTNDSQPPTGGSRCTVQLTLHDVTPPVRTWLKNLPYLQRVKQFRARSPLSLP